MPDAVLDIARLTAQLRRGDVPHRPHRGDLRSHRRARRSRHLHHAGPTRDGDGRRRGARRVRPRSPAVGRALRRPRTTSTSRASRRRPPAPPSPTRLMSPPPPSRGSSRPARCSSARPISTSSRPVSSACAPPIPCPVTPTIPRSCPAGRVRARRSRSRTNSSASRSARIRRDRDGCRRPSTTSWASTIAQRDLEPRHGAGLPDARHDLGVRADGR